MAIKDEEDRVRKLMRRTPHGLVGGGIVEGAKEAWRGAGREFRQAADQPTQAGKIGAGLRAAASFPVRFLGAAEADIIGQAANTAEDVGDVAGRFGRALLTGEERRPSPPPDMGRISTAAPDVQPLSLHGTETETTGVQGKPQEIVKKRPQKNYIRDAEGNITFLTDEGDIQTMDRAGRDITGTKRTPFRGTTQPAVRRAGTQSRPKIEFRSPNRQLPMHPDYSSPDPGPPKLADLINRRQTFGEFVTGGPLRRALQFDLEQGIRREEMAQRGDIAEQDRALRAAGLAQQAVSGAQQLEQQRVAGEEEREIRRAGLTQAERQAEREASLQGEKLDLQRSKIAWEAANEQANQQRLERAIELFDDPNTPERTKQRARRIIEQLGGGRVDVSPDEEGFSERQATESLQKTYQNIAGQGMAFDPTSIEQLQSAAQINPAAWRGVYGKMTPEEVRDYNTLRRLPDEKLVQQEQLVQALEAKGIEPTPDNIRDQIEAQARVQREG